MGIRSGKSTTLQALLTGTNDWLEIMESGIETAAVFFDFTKVFHSVPHKALIELRPRVYYSVRPRGSRLHAAYSSVCDPNQALGF